MLLGIEVGSKRLTRSAKNRNVNINSSVESIFVEWVMIKYNDVVSVINLVVEITSKTESMNMFLKLIPLAASSPP